MALPAHKEPPAHNFSLPATAASSKFRCRALPCDLSVGGTGKEGVANNNRNISTTNVPVKTGFCYHLGALVFAPFFSLVEKGGFGECGPYVTQWLTAVLLGAKNIEQSKLLNYKSLKLFLERPERNLHMQRKMLKQFATDGNIYKLLVFNAVLVGVGGMSDFYYDPHTKHYTGLRKILKSWCSTLRMAAKVINTDFIHTVDGFPVYLNNGDTFHDMRYRFFKDIKRFRTIANMPTDKIITICVDRGIFSFEVFHEILKLSNLHIVTWEKGYKCDKWGERQETKIGAIVKVKNNKQDTRLICYKYQEYKWEKNNKIRQIIVRLPEKSGNGFVEVSILTDDLSRDAVRAINLILNRWIQENDFKYEICHFGIDQITSYYFDYYKNISDTVTDKEHISGNYKALTKELEINKRKLKTALYKEHGSAIKFGIYDDISELIEKQTGKPANELITERMKKLTNVQIGKNTKPPTKKQVEAYKKNLESIVEKSQKEKELQQERANTEKQVSKIEELIKNEMQKLQTGPKQFLDIIKIIARNIFYLAFEPYKEKYNNYRDDHVVFRAFTRSGGTIKYNGTLMKINIIPAMEISPKQRRALSEILDDINRQNIRLPNNSNQKFMLELNEKLEPFFAFGN